MAARGVACARARAAPARRAAAAAGARGRAAARRVAPARCCAAAAADAGESALDTKAAALKPHIDGVPIYLVGMMGSGKTTVGGILSSKLEYMCFDTDSVIEQATGRAVSEIFSEEGEDAFRALETDVLKQLAPLTRTVICTGGGAVMRVENWGCMTHGISVWIDPPVASLARRVAAQGSDSRPLASDGGVLESVEDIEERLEALREERESQYKQADIHLEVKGASSPEQVAEYVLDEIEKRVRETLVKKNMAAMQAEAGGFGELGNINVVPEDDAGKPLL